MAELVLQQHVDLEGGQFGGDLPGDVIDQIHPVAPSRDRDDRDLVAPVAKPRHEPSIVAIAAGRFLEPS